jgi:hypothetical protein
MRQVATALRLLPNGATAHAAALDVAPAERAAIAACPACAHSVLQDLVNFASQLVRLVERSNEQVCLFFPDAMALWLTFWSGCGRDVGLRFKLRFVLLL